MVNKETQWIFERVDEIFHTYQTSGVEAARKVFSDAIIASSTDTSLVNAAYAEYNKNTEK